MEETLYGVGAVNLAGFVIRSRDGLQARQNQHQIVAHGAPDADDGAGKQGCIGIGKPVNPSYAKQDKELIQDARFRVENPLPHHSHRSGGRYHGQEINGAVNIPAANFGIQQ